MAIPPYALPIPIVGGLVGNSSKARPREHKILSDNARMLLGTIYMPQGRLIIDANKPIADKSAYTVLVVQRIDPAFRPEPEFSTRITAPPTCRFRPASGPMATASN
jgi:hypothetical protein